MAGSDCYRKHRNSKSYCEGMMARVASAITTNPHESGSEAADAWDAGVAVANAAAGSTIAIADQGCCAAGGTVAT